MEKINSQLEYESLKRCMSEAIRDGMAYERKRREKACLMYIGAMILLGLVTAYLLHSGRTIFGFSSSDVIVATVFFVIMQLCFLWWVFTRWL